MLQCNAKPLLLLFNRHQVASLNNISNNRFSKIHELGAFMNLSHIRTITKWIARDLLRIRNQKEIQSPACGSHLLVLALFTLRLRLQLESRYANVRSSGFPKPYLKPLQNFITWLKKCMYRCGWTQHSKTRPCECVIVSLLCLCIYYMYVLDDNTRIK